MELSEAQIRDYALDDAIYQQGKNCYEAGGVVALEIDEHSQPDFIMVHGTVIDHKQYYDINLSIDKDDYQIQTHLCSCDQQLTCYHVIAVLFKVFERNALRQDKKRLDEGQPSDEWTKQLISSYERSELYQSLAFNIQKQVRLEPVLEFHHDITILTLKIGIDKMYIIKDIPQFVRDMQEHVQKSYGRDLAFFHHESILDGASRVLYEYVQRHSRDRYYFQNERPFRIPYESRCLPLTKDALDEFFTMYLDQEVLYRYEDKHLTNLPFCDRNPAFTMLVEEQRKQYHFHLNRYDYRFAEGSRHLYILIDRRLHRCDREYSKACRQFLMNLQRKQSALLVHESDMTAFYHHIITQIKDYIPLSGADISAYAPQPLTARLYLDMPRAQTLSAKLIYNYGDMEYPAFAPFSGNAARNYHEEIQIRMLLTRFMTRIDPEQETAYIENSQDALYEFFQNGFPLLSEVCAVYATDKIRSVQIKNSVSITMGVHMHSDLLEIDLNTYDFPIEELRNVLKAYHLHKKYYRMKNGSFVNIEDNALHELSQLLDGMRVSEQELQKGVIRVPAYRSLYVDNIVKENSLLKMERDHAFKEVIKGIRSSQDNDFEVPAHLKPILRNYQKAGYRWLKTMANYGFGGILADDMGIGKTLQIITLLEDEKLNNPQAQSLVICPSSLILNWQSEISKFSDTLTCCVIHGNAGQRQRKIAAGSDYDVLVTSYDYIKRDLPFYEGKTFTYQIIDEAQFIKNHNTKNAQSVKQINSIHKFALTGTPIENSLAELWSIFDFLMPGYLYEYPYFKKMYEQPIVKNQDQGIRRNLQKLVEPFILRRVKKDVLKELPKKVETTILIDLHEEARKLYQANAAQARQEIRESDSQGNNKIMILSMLTRLRQLCCDPRLVYHDYPHVSAKLEACIELIENCIQSQKKVLVFSQFTSLLALLEERLTKQQIDYYLLKGSTPKMQRQQMVNAFNTNQIPVFLISLKAGGTGLNLTSAEAVIHFDPWWNISAQNQATDRAYRIGQHNNVQVFQLIARDTIEEKIMQLQSQKQQLSDSIIQENSGIITRMSTDELLDLF